MGRRNGEKEFASFKADMSGHLKLLFCIDLLNEGVHVGDVSGVILLRPTASPTLCLQQIGRSLSAGKAGHFYIYMISLFTLWHYFHLFCVFVMESKKDTDCYKTHFICQGKEILNDISSLTVFF